MSDNNPYTQQSPYNPGEPSNPGEPYNAGQPYTQAAPYAPAVPNAGDVESARTRALVAMIIGFVCGGTIPGILGLVAFLKANDDPQQSRTLTKWAWIVFGIFWAIGIIFFILYVVLIIFVTAGTAPSGV
ncbi:hypothetical protein [Devriesea agamarum]|uniref:hypothetical protein n=1 Tax=Devriesea agamarum TaxID=472569 RepID=UPI001E52E24F|nr:hypothetical protein [Devriesea agamarum]